MNVGSVPAAFMVGYINDQETNLGVIKLEDKIEANF